jgi:hypothetical protein
MNAKSTRTRFLLVLPVVLLPTLAFAQSVSLSTPVLQTESYIVDLNGENASNQTLSVSGYDTLQEFTISTADETPSNLGLPLQLNLFCTELGQSSPGSDSQPSPTTYTVVPLTSADAGRSAASIDAYDGVPVTGIGSAMAAKLEKLYGYVFQNTYSASSPTNITFPSLTLTGGSGAAYDAAVFQLAAWQIAENNSFGNIGSSGPGFFVSGAPTGLVSDADSLLTAVSNASNVTLLNLDALHSSTGQDYILPDPTNSFIPIPEPGTYAAILGAFALCLALRRRIATV